MFLKYGQYTHAAGEVSIAIAREGQFVNGMEIGYTERWDIQGRLQIDDQGSPAANQAAMTPIIGALQTGYSQQGNDLVFYTDGGAVSIHALISAQTSGGVRITKRPSFSQGRGAEYSTFRNYEIGAEATFLNTSLGIIEYQESISFTGGGPKFVLLATQTGRPQKQNTRAYTPFSVVQEGSATGMFGYPIPPGPISPSDLHQDQGGPRLIGPQFIGPPGKRIFHGFKVAWSYHMESANPITGQPSVPIN